MHLQASRFYQPRPELETSTEQPQQARFLRNLRAVRGHVPSKSTKSVLPILMGQRSSRTGAVPGITASSVV
jgi:hypothetical protein